MSKSQELLDRFSERGQHAFHEPAVDALLDRLTGLLNQPPATWTVRHLDLVTGAAVALRLALERPPREPDPSSFEGAGARWLVAEYELCRHKTTPPPKGPSTEHR